MKNGILEFEWDPKKAASNLRKHSVSFREAAMVFGDVLAFTYRDSVHSRGEERYITIGMSMKVAFYWFLTRRAVIESE